MVHSFLRISQNIFRPQSPFQYGPQLWAVSAVLVPPGLSQGGPPGPFLGFILWLRPEESIQAENTRGTIWTLETIIFGFNSFLICPVWKKGIFDIGLDNWTRWKFNDWYYLIHIKLIITWRCVFKFLSQMKGGNYGSIAHPLPSNLIT